MDRQPVILVVDDTASNIKLLDAVLTPRGYTVITAQNGHEAISRAADGTPDLILLDVVMPGMDGYEVCRRLRADPATAMLPVVMITASGDQDKVQAIDTGADDYITKPFNQSELLARIRSLLRIKFYHDTIQRQAAELAEWNQTLEQRVQEKVEEVERLGRLRRFLSPQLADVILKAGDERLLDSHRREITVVFCDMRGFTAFAETAEPEDVTSVLREYHGAVGPLIHEYEGTLERFAGDGFMVFFNDPIPCEDAASRAVHMTIAMRSRVAELAEGWRRRGHQLDFGAGIAVGYATCGAIGFEGRFDYAAIGTVTNLAARLSGEAGGGQILISQRVYACLDKQIEAEAIGELNLKGFHTPIHAYNVVGLSQGTMTAAGSREGGA
jgi:adenylate cyclase